ncbi:MAG: hypothetical protein S4CHLAM37_08140 [Chlamydiia bacterium]|nr:hypothetical protein [Chlamydiia bacterium]
MSKTVYGNVSFFLEHFFLQRLQSFFSSGLPHLLQLNLSLPVRILPIARPIAHSMSATVARMIVSVKVDIATTFSKFS